MKKLSEYKDEEALDLLADLLEPASEIFSDTKIAAIIINKGYMMDAVKIAIKHHKKSVIELLAILEGVPVEEYHCNVFSLPMKLLDIVNDSELLDFFSYQGQEITKESFGSAMVNTGEEKK